MARDSDGIYKRKDRLGYWTHWRDAQGKRKWRKLNVRTLQQARRVREAELLRVEQAKCLGFTPPGAETFSEVAKRFLAHQKARLSNKSYEREHGIINQHLGKFFAGPLANIRRIDIQRYITKRTGEVSMHSVQKELNVLKHLLRLSAEWEIIPASPAQGLKSPRVPAGRLRYLQPTELRSLLAACPEWLQPIVLLAVATGMRRSEILGLRRQDIDFSQRRIMLPQTKNGDGRVVYLNQLALAAIRSVPRPPDANTIGLVFRGIKPERVSVAFARVCRSQQVFDFRFHDLRHTAASWLRMKGADIHTVAQLLGHKDLRMAARYQHLSPGFMAQAVESLDQVFELPCYPSVIVPKQLTSEVVVNA